MGKYHAPATNPYTGVHEAVKLRRLRGASSRYLRGRVSPRPATYRPLRVIGTYSWYQILLVRAWGGKRELRYVRA